MHSKKYKIIVILIIITLAMQFILPITFAAESYRYSYNGSNINTGKYPGYKEKIDKLKQAHPNWEFIIMDTKLDWEQVIKAQAAGCNASPKSLIQARRGEWLCPICLNKPYDNGSWFHASEKAIKYYMDPRNWLEDNPYLFQFLATDYIEVSDDQILAALRGTFLANNREVASTLNNACRNENLNVYYIVARLIQEQGPGGGGTWRMESDGKYYYNLFNIGAYGNSTATIMANALRKAKDNGWDSLEKCVRDSIRGTISNYNQSKQNTLYLNKFDVELYNGIYWHQYMQNIEAPKNEAMKLYNNMQRIGALDQHLKFVIPVYDGMVSKEDEPDTSREIRTVNIKLKDGRTKYNVRAATTTNSKSVGQVADSNVNVLADAIIGEWYRVILEDGTKGYIYYDPNIWEETTRVTTGSEKRILTGDKVNLRAGPGITEPIVTQLNINQIVTRIDNSGRYNIDGIIWDRVILADNKEGFVSRKYLGEVKRTATVNSSNGLYLRDAPGGDNIFVMENGVELSIIELTNEEIDGHIWAKVVTAKGVVGYCAYTYLHEENAPVEVPEVKPKPEPKPDIKPEPKPEEVDKNQNFIKKDDTLEIICGSNVDLEALKKLGDVKLINTEKQKLNTIGTGAKLVVNGKSYTIIKLGDVNGDGRIRANDYVRIENHIMEIKELLGIEAKAADVSGDGKIRANDYVRIENLIMQDKIIKVKK